MSDVIMYCTQCPSAAQDVRFIKKKKKEEEGLTVFTDKID